MGAKAVIHVGIGLICFGIAALTYPSVTSMSKVVENAHQQSSIQPGDHFRFTLGRRIVADGRRRIGRYGSQGFPSLNHEA